MRCRENLQGYPTDKTFNFFVNIGTKLFFFSFTAFSNFTRASLTTLIHKIKLFFIFIEQTMMLPSCLTTWGNCYSGVGLFMQFVIFLIDELVESPLKSEIWRYPLECPVLSETKQTNDKFSKKFILKQDLNWGSPEWQPEMVTIRPHHSP